MNINRRVVCHLKMTKLIFFIAVSLIIDIAVDGKADLPCLLLYLLHVLAYHINFILPILTNYLMILSHGIIFDLFTVGILFLTYLLLEKFIFYFKNTFPTSQHHVFVSYQTYHLDVIKAFENIP